MNDCRNENILTWILWDIHQKWVILIYNVTQETLQCASTIDAHTEGERAQHLLCIAYCTVKQNNSNNKITWKLLYCRRWHSYTMHLRHVIGPGLFHFHLSAKYLSLSFFPPLTLSLHLSVCVVRFIFCIPQIFPCTRTPCPRIFLANFQLDFAPNNLFRSVWWNYNNSSSFR